MIGRARLHLGAGHEDEVAARLRGEGWDVQPWGQGILTDATRHALQEQPQMVLWRWIPDLVAVRGNVIRLVDPKSDWREETGNFSIEMHAHIAHLRMWGLGLVIVYVFADFSTNTPMGIKPWRYENYPSRTSGSGTPYLLVRQADQNPWEWAFGRPQERMT